MATLKLNKKSPETSKRSRAPVRRGDPAKRDRSAAPTVTVESKVEPTKPAPAPQDNADSIYKGKPISRSEFAEKQDAHKPKKAKKNNDEQHYRQSPRRGGKLKDGYDAEKTMPATKKKQAASDAETKLPRLSKVMADRGICSRREADEWIANSWVKVNGEIIDTLGTRVAPDADIVISGYAQEAQAELKTILLHKPVGYVSGQAEDGYEPAVVLLHPDNQWEDDLIQQTFQRSIFKGIAPAGRLDIDSTGLLVLTQDGRVARKLIGENSSVEKEYLVRVTGDLNESGLKSLNYGLSLDGVKLKPAKVSWQNEDQLRFVLREGKKRQIRRMCEMVGLTVVGLKRIRIGSVKLGKLPAGKWRYLGENERF